MNKIAISKSSLHDAIACTGRMSGLDFPSAVAKRIERISRLQDQIVRSRSLNSLLINKGLVDKRNRDSAAAIKRINDLKLMIGKN